MTDVYPQAPRGPQGHKARVKDSKKQESDEDARSANEGTSFIAIEDEIGYAEDHDMTDNKACASSELTHTVSNVPTP